MYWNFLKYKKGSHRNKYLFKTLPVLGIHEEQVSISKIKMYLKI